MGYKITGFLFLCITASSMLYAQKKPLPPYQPSRAEMMDRYKKAQLLDSALRNTVFKTNVQANWLPGGTAFWYRNILKDSMREYI